MNSAPSSCHSYWTTAVFGLVPEPIVEIEKPFEVILCVRYDGSAIEGDCEKAFIQYPSPTLATAEQFVSFAVWSAPAAPATV
jgi:hypothetical protein